MRNGGAGWSTQLLLFYTGRWAVCSEQEGALETTQFVGAVGGLCLQS